MRWLILAALVAGCSGAGVSGSLQPLPNTNVTVGAKVDADGTVRPTGGLGISLF